MAADQLSTAPVSDNGEEGSGVPDGLRREISAVSSTTSTLSSEELEFAYKRIVSTAKSSGYENAIDEAFDALDISNTGNLNRCDIQQFLLTAAAHTKLEDQVNESVIEAAVDALIWDLSGGDDDDEKAFISKQQFHQLFSRHPDLLTAFEDDIELSKRRSAVLNMISSERQKEWDVEEIEDEKESWLHYILTHLRNRWVTIVWILIYIGANVGMFAYKANVYSNHDEAQAVFGTCITVARGCASALNLNAFLVLLVMCKHFVTLLRKTPLRFCVLFDGIQEAHILIGIVFGLFALSHTCAHICDFHRLAYANDEDVDALFPTRNIPQSPSARWGYMLSTRAGITGIIMVVCLVVAYSFAIKRTKHFNSFWYTHHLLLVMLICLCIHGTGNLLEPYQSLYWVIGPLALYAIPRICRETPLSTTEVLKVEIKKGDVVQLRLKKPKYYNGYIKSGMYGFLNVGSVSKTEWHPFTFTSGEDDEYIEFHFRKVGDWTGKVYDLLQSKADDRLPTGIKEPPRMKVEGPIGASSQGFSDYTTLVLVGAGIGITPMISVLKQLLVDPGKVKRCYFYWTVRDRDSFVWFTDLMDEIYEADKKNLLQIRHFLTSVKYDARDLGAVLLHHATRAHHKRTNVDLLLGQQIHHQVEVGRPDWKEELESVREETQSLDGESMCGIFLCGPSKMADAVYEASVDVSKTNPGFHMYFSKETF